MFSTNSNQCLLPKSYAYRRNVFCINESHLRETPQFCRVKLQFCRQKQVQGGVTPPPTHSPLSAVPNSLSPTNPRLLLCVYALSTVIHPRGEINIIIAGITSSSQVILICCKKRKGYHSFSISFV